MEKLVVELRIFEGQDLTDIAVAVNKSATRVGQIFQSALQRLRHPGRLRGRMRDYLESFPEA